MESSSGDRRRRTTAFEKKVDHLKQPEVDASNASKGLILGELVGLPEETKVLGSHFGIGTVVAVIRFVLEGAISMRGASRICGIINNIAGREPFDYPSHTTVQNCILRLGLFILRRNIQRHDDWIWVADHTYSIGTLKVFIVLGIRLADFIVLDRALQYQDLTPLTAGINERKVRMVG